jgi:hypothetical protein
MNFYISLFALLAAPVAMAAPVADTINSPKFMDMSMKAKRAGPGAASPSVRSEPTVDIDTAYSFPDSWAPR